MGQPPILRMRLKIQKKILKLPLQIHTEYYEAFDAEQIQLRPRSLEEELKACKEQMLNVKEDLKAAHEKVKTSDN